MAPWSAQRAWAVTAGYHKGIADRLTRWSLGLGIGGAIVATLGQQVKTLVAVDWVPMVLGGAGAAAIALGAFLSRQAQADDRERVWTRCRSAAESLKSGIFLYRAAAPPFDGADRVAQIGALTEKVLKEMEGIERRAAVASQTPPALGPLTVDQYIAERVQEQVAWYERRAREHQTAADRFRLATTVLGAISALLALASTVTALSAWAPVVATATASITAQLKNRRLQTLTAMYDSTALRLRLLLGEWAESRKADTDSAERNAFIRRCEETMANENGAWLAMWKKDAGAAAPAGATPKA
jgi:hypothetical protein